ncbi:MAG: hypothetical protein KGI54_18315 [Pseudomonadota bacterium]|nr:hypothetical protein [Pseudomonadota bacterium]
MDDLSLEITVAGEVYLTQQSAERVATISVSAHQIALLRDWLFWAQTSIEKNAIIKGFEHK